MTWKGERQIRRRKRRIILERERRRRNKGVENGWKEKILKAEREIGDGNIEMEQRERGELQMEQGNPGF